jgi:hypothetical protein
MNRNSDHLRNHLRSNEALDSPTSEGNLSEAPSGEKLISPQSDQKENSPRRRPMKNLLLMGFIAIAVVSMYQNRGNSPINPFTWITEIPVNIGGPSEDLLNSMQASLANMGYGTISHDELRALRRDGLTATYVSNVRAIGYNDLTIEEAVRLVKADASSAFIAMMTELGYTLTINDIVNLRSAGVTAHFTSNVHDLGYRDVTTEQLIRMRRIGVSADLIRRLQSERGADVPLEDIIRYRISNQ